MLSYQHIYHAGNVVDCQKHALLCALLSRLHAEVPAFTYLDTHSGRGLYDLASPEAQKIREYRDGIDRLWPRHDWPDAIAPYQQILERLNPDGIVRFYPGSAVLAASMVRYYDMAAFYELHPQEHQVLAHEMQRFGNVSVHRHDGWDALGHLPAIDNQGVILIDPSYELKGEYNAMAGRVTTALKRWRDAIILIWYPLLPANRHAAMLADFKAANLRALRTEIMTKAPEDGGLYGTGMLVVNPPPSFDETVAHVSAWLAGALGIGQMTDWLGS